MIYGISGKPGGGKSYECVVNHIIPTVTKSKRKVVTNIPLNVEHFASIYGDYVRDLIEVVDGEFHNFGKERPFSRIEHFMKYKDWQNEQGQKVYFFIDEAHLAMPNRGQRAANEEIREWFSMARHEGFDVMLISQSLSKVHREIRELISVHYRAIKKDFIGQHNKYVLKVYSDATSLRSSAIATHERKYDKQYYPFYQSHSKSNQAIQEAAPSDVKPWYKNKFIYLCGVFFFAGFLILTFGNKKPINHDVIQKQQSLITNTATPKPQQMPISAEDKFNNSSQKSSPKTPKHPFFKVNLHISGWADYTELGKRKKDYHFSASQNGQYIFDLNLRDLILAGYEVIVRSPCMIEIAFEDYTDYLTCDSPKVGLKAPENMPSPES